MKADRKMIKKAIVCAFEELLGFAPACSRVVFTTDWGELFYVYRKDGSRKLYKFGLESLDGDYHSCFLMIYRHMDDSWITVGKSHGLWDFFHSEGLHND